MRTSNTTNTNTTYRTTLYSSTNRVTRARANRYRRSVDTDTILGFALMLPMITLLLLV